MEARRTTLRHRRSRPLRTFLRKVARNVAPLSSDGPPAMRQTRGGRRLLSKRTLVDAYVLSRLRIHAPVSGSGRGHRVAFEDTRRHVPSLSTELDDVRAKRARSHADTHLGKGSGATHRTSHACTPAQHQLRRMEDLVL